MKLSILIISIIDRADQLNALKMELDRQAAELNLIKDEDYEIKTYIDNGEKSKGEKREVLQQSASGEYSCFIDDDDEISKDYMRLIFSKICPDCLSLTGIYEVDGKYDGIFEHSTKYSQYRTNTHDYPKYERYPNHLNVIRTAIAKKYHFVPINHGEDTEWATQIFKAGEIKNEAEIKEVLYHYKFNSKK